MRSNIWYVLTTLDFKDRAALGGVCVHIFTLQFLPNLAFPFFPTNLRLLVLVLFFRKPTYNQNALNFNSNLKMSFFTYLNMCIICNIFQSVTFA